MSDVLVDPDGLAELVEAGERGDGARVRILDVRWRLDRPDGRPAFAEGHIPGAVYVDLDTELAAHGAPTDGRHPLPEPADLQDAARRWGLNDGDIAVVYDDLGSMSAARAWWVLADAGVDVRILDGGLGAWTASGRPLASGPVDSASGNVTLRAGMLPRLTIDEAAELATSAILLDVRAPERYRGEVEPVDPRAGHIPGAVNLPTADNIDATGRFLAPEALRERALAAGVVPGAELGVSCGSGVTASHAFVALTLAGFAPKLYPGSWSQWANHPERDIVTGAAPR